jgi:hypothetical protein
MVFIVPSTPLFMTNKCVGREPLGAFRRTHCDGYMGSCRHAILESRRRFLPMMIHLDPR